MVFIIAYLLGMDNLSVGPFWISIRFIPKVWFVSVFNSELVRSTQNKIILKRNLTKLKQNQNKNRVEVLWDVHA